jgi:hypothetical protein
MFAFLENCEAFFIGVMKIVMIGMPLSFKYHSVLVMLFFAPSDELWSANF